MKKFLIVFVSLVTLLAFFSLTLAVDRVPKESKAKEKEKPAEFKKYEKTETKEGKTKGSAEGEKKSEKAKKQTKGTVLEKLTKWRKSTETQKAKEKYDYFMDRNNNGIDDRLERKSKKSPSPSVVRPVSKKKQPTKSAPSIKETPKKKKIIKEAPKEKEVKKARKTEEKKGR